MDATTDLTYYILFPKDTEEDCIKDTNQLGTVSKKKKYVDGKFIFYNEYVFHKNVGFDVLQKVINQRPDMLHKVRIITSNGKHISVENFINRLDDISEII